MKNKKLYRIYMRNISQIDRKNKHKKKIKKVNINPAGRHIQKMTSCFFVDWSNAP